MHKFTILPEKTLNLYLQWCLL